jgi:hypothetical protein
MNYKAGIFLLISIFFVFPCFAPPANDPSSYAAKSYFICQSNDKTHTTGLPSNGDCGPTCLAMVAKRWFKIPIGLSASPEGVDDLISYIRQLMTGKEKRRHGTSDTQIAQAAEALGIKASVTEKLTIKTLDAELDSGHMVIANGNPMAPGAYGHSHGGAKLYGGGHFILIVGRTKNGDYVINDPANKDSPLTITQGGLSCFLRPQNHGSGVLLSPN